MSDVNPLTEEELTHLRCMGYDEWMATDSSAATLLMQRTLATLDAERARAEKAEAALAFLSGVFDTLSPQEVINVVCDGLGVARQDYAGTCAGDRSLVELGAELADARHGCERLQRGLDWWNRNFGERPSIKRIRELEAALEKMRECEAECCPEDVPFDEYIRSLEKQVEAFNSYAGVMGLLKALLDAHYPASVFDGSSGDEGALMVVAARKVVESEAAAGAAVAERDAVAKAAFRLLVSCLRADANEELTGEVDGSDMQGVRDVLADCPDCAGHGSRDKLPHEDEVLEDDNICPRCEGWGILPEARRLRAAAEGR